MPAGLKQRIFLAIPTNLDRLYRASKSYVDRHEGELNGDMDTNGEMWLAEQVCTTATVVFDVGANRGQWSRRALKANKNIALHSFEPSSQVFPALVAAAPGAIANQFGLSSSKSVATLHSFGDSDALSSLYPRRSIQPTDRELTETGTESIQLDTLDNYCATMGIRQIDFLKIDVEGHDLEVLRGGTTMLRHRAVRLIQFEYGGCNLDSGLFLSHFFEFLQPLGYELAKLLPDALRPVSRYHRGLETFRYQNWIAYPHDSPPRVKMRH